jgi:hypothetical protein
MKVPGAKAAPYTVVVILVGLVIAVVIGTLTAFMGPGRAFG